MPRVSELKRNKKSASADLRPLWSADEIDERIREISRQVTVRYKDKHPLFVCFLKGGAPFAARLMFAIADQNPDFHPELDYMIISTYKDGYEAGEPRIVTDLAPDVVVKDRIVVMLDDLRDTGATAAFAEKHFLARGAAQVDYVTLVLKTNEAAKYKKPDIYGFECPKEYWLVGMGMDNSGVLPEACRWMSSIAVYQPAESN